MLKRDISNKTQIISWCLFDFANSSYSAIIASVIFPVYYANMIVGNIDGSGDLWWGRAISLSMFIVSISSPILGGMADYSGKRKAMLCFFVILCSFSVSSFISLERGDVFKGFILIVLANLGMEGAVVFYNSFLPLISPKNYLGRVSSFGFAVGYLGSILSLIFALFFAKDSRYDCIWLMVSVFFLVFSIPLFISLPKDERKMSFLLSLNNGFKYIFCTIKLIKKSNNLKKFLLAYFLYADGINTVIVFSTIFATTTLGFDNIEIIKLFLIVQITALIGSVSFAKLIDKKGPSFVIILSLLFWILVTISAYFTESKYLFWVIASIAGLGLGTIQSASRTLFTYFIPVGKESEYFGIYSLVGKTSAILGPLLYGQISAIYKSQRPAIISIGLFFLAGLYIILSLKSYDEE